MVPTENVDLSRHYFKYNNGIPYIIFLITKFYYIIIQEFGVRKSFVKEVK
jgi:hypothetical protein